MTSGVIYMCWGSQACIQASASIASLRKLSKHPVCIIGDKIAEDYFKNRDVKFIYVDANPYSDTAPANFKFMAGRIKPLMAKLTPFDQTLYVDADTSFRKSPDIGFSLLKNADVIIAETQTRTIVDTVAGDKESKYTCKLFNNTIMLYHNSGMIFWKKNEVTNKLFDLWSEEWLRFENWDEQVALLRALLLSDAVFTTVPYTWNCRQGREVFFVHHWFGTGTARTKNPKPARIRNIHPRSGEKMIKVEVSPGRFVKCFSGDEDKIIQKFRTGRRTNG